MTRRNSPRLTTRTARRRGAIVVLAAILMVVMIAMVAFGVDLGYVCLVRGELQRSADASALAGAGSLYELYRSAELYTYPDPADLVSARSEAQRYAALNDSGPYRQSLARQLYADLNLTNDSDGDIVLGKYITGRDFIPSLSGPNAVQCQLRFGDDHPNGALPLFFARVLGRNFVDVRATAIARIAEYPFLIPFTVSVELWESTDEVTDQYSYEKGQIVEVGDGIRELTVYPGNWDGSDLPPGNFGALQIGPDSGTPVLRSQIDYGPTTGDFEFHGGKLYEGIQLPGSTGLKADVETALLGGSADGISYAGVMGKTRYLPLYSDVTGNGQNATFTIVKFVAVRLMAADLKGKVKKVVVQPLPESDLQYTMALVQ